MRKMDKEDIYINPTKKLLGYFYEYRDILKISNKTEEVYRRRKTHETFETYWDMKYRKGCYEGYLKDNRMYDKVMKLINYTYILRNIDESKLIRYLSSPTPITHDEQHKDWFKYISMD